jgi:pterin-4a-carbinolamine dehydratase
MINASNEKYLPRLCSLQGWKIILQCKIHNKTPSSFNFCYNIQRVATKQNKYPSISYHVTWVEMDKIGILPAIPFH